MRFNLYKAYGPKKRSTNLACVVLLSVCTVVAPAQGRLLSSGRQQKEASARIRAEQILKQARDATRAELKGTEIKTLIINSKSETSQSIPQLPNRKLQGTTDEELSVSLPDKMRKKSVATYTTNQEIAEWVIDGDRLAQKSDVLVDGKPINFVASGGSQTSEKQKIASHKDYVFTILFPVIFDASWYPPLEFSYVGVAESKGVKADVVETRSPTGTTYRLFFDQQTHLLLLLSETWISERTKTEKERKHFFSDYRNEDNLLVAHKIVVEQGGEVTEERVIKRLQVNATFKPDFFAVKEK